MQQHPNNSTAPGGVQHDDSGEGDLEYFLARPLEHTRVRSPFPNEFGEFLPRRAGKEPLVIVAINRNAVTGEPGDRARGIVFVDGGRA
jgi:hypothetical protein